MNQPNLRRLNHILDHVSVSRVGAQIGAVPATLMIDVDEAPRLHLAL